MCSDAPDNRGLNRAAEASAKLGQEYSEWFRSEYDRTAPDRAAAAQRANAVSDAQLEAMNFATEQARREDERFRTQFQPLEDRIVADAQTFDTPERRADAAARAAADVESQFGRAVQGMNRDALRRGGSVDDGSYRGTAADMALGRARMTAGATDQAVRNIEAQGHARMMDAAGLGRGVVSNQATQQQIATSTGNASVGNSGAALNATNSGAGLMNTGFNTALRGQGQAGQLYGQAAQIEAQANNNSGLFGALGSLGGAAIFKYSDPKVKKNRKPTDEDKALEQIENTPVEDFDYDPAKGGPAGMGRQTGPMAPDVLATMGPKVAPAGKVIDMHEMGGRLMAGMKALARRVEKIEKEVA